LIIIVLIVLSLFWGSFLGVLASRRTIGASALWGRSKCLKCKKTLNWFELIPIISFLFLKGKCSGCRKRISYFYPVVEILTVVIVLLAIISENNIVATIILIFAYSVMLVGSIRDILWQEVESWILIAIVVLSLAYALASRGFVIQDLVISLVGGIIIPLLFVVLSHEKWMGWGDVFFAAALGLILGQKYVYWGIVSSFIIGGLFAIILIATGRANLKSRISFGPFIFVAVLIVKLLSVLTTGFFPY